MEEAEVADRAVDERSPRVAAELPAASYRLGSASALPRLLGLLDAAEEDLAEAILNAVEDLANSGMRHQPEADAEAVLAAVARVADRLPRLAGHSRAVVLVWHPQERPQE
jgi:predicted RNA polymerase sigma factor